MTAFENEADALRHQIEGNIYSLSSLARIRGDIIRLIENMDDIVDILESSLFQFEIRDLIYPQSFMQILLSLQNYLLWR